MSQVVVTKKLVKTFRQGELEVQALRGIDLEIEKGAFTTICGPSGSGKTTLLNIIGGLDEPTSGEVYVSGKRIDGLGQRALAEMRLRDVGFIFQSYNLIPVLSALENVGFVMQLQGVPRKRREQLARDLLREVGLEGMEDRRPGQLSGGQQQRVAVARAIVGSPSIVLADEPTANLDSTTADGLLQLMRTLNEEKGVSFIFSTHDSLVMDYARRVITLHDGLIEQEDVRG